MFCPQAVVWGNVSEVFSAVGTVGAVVLALWLAVSDHFRRADDRKAELSRNLEIEKEFLISYERLGRKMVEFSEVLRVSFLLTLNAGDKIDKASALSYLSVIRASAERYMMMPSIPIAAYNRFQSFMLYVDGVIAALNQAEEKMEAFVITSLIDGICERWGHLKKCDASKDECDQPKAS